MDLLGSYDVIVPKFKKLVAGRGDKDFYLRGTFTHENLDFAEDVLAIADEAHKVLIVGRHCQWDEAGINIVGVIMGVLLTWSILWLIRWARGTLED